MLIPPSLADSVQLRLIYDARTTYPLLDLFLILFVGIVIGGLWKIRTEGGLSNFNEENARDIFRGLVMVAFGSFGTLMIVMLVVVPDIGIRRAMNDGRFNIREGVVRHYHGVGLLDHDMESWWLVTSADSVQYRYATGLQKAGYSQVGKLSEGAWVRVWDVNRDIGRLEAAP